MNSEDYLSGRLEHESVRSDLFWDGYHDFKIGAFLKAVREDKGMTQAELAARIHTTKSVISRMENHAEDLKLSTLQRVASALGKQVIISIQ